MSEIQLDEEYRLRRRRRDELVVQYGYEEGLTIALEEDVEFVIDRLNAYERYAELVERWSRSMKRKYILVDKRQVAIVSHAEAYEVEHS